jgi:hypothetical protein
VTAARVPMPRRPVTPAASFSTWPQTVWQANANQFASTPGAYIDQERRAVVRRALALIVEGRPGYAEFVLARSVMRQARIAGLGDIEIPACPRCGTRCPGHQVTS